MLASQKQLRAAHQREETHNLCGRLEKMQQVDREDMFKPSQTENSISFVRRVPNTEVSPPSNNLFLFHHLSVFSDNKRKERGCPHNSLLLSLHPPIYTRKKRGRWNAFPLFTSTPTQIHHIQPLKHSIKHQLASKRNNTGGLLHKSKVSALLASDPLLNLLPPRLISLKWSPGKNRRRRSCFQNTALIQNLLSTRIFACDQVGSVKSQRLKCVFSFCLDSHSFHSIFHSWALDKQYTCVFSLNSWSLSLFSWDVEVSSGFFCLI